MLPQEAEVFCLGYTYLSNTRQFSNLLKYVCSKASYSLTQDEIYGMEVYEQKQFVKMVEF